MTVAQSLSIYFFVLFSHAGLNIPFWPIWLRDQGLSEAWVGLIAGAALWARVISTPFVGAYADRHLAQKRLLIWMGLGAAVSFAFFSVSQNPYWILAVTVVNGLLLMPTVALADNLALLRAQSDGFDYARARVWGSIAFMVFSFGVGHWLAGRSSDWIFIWLFGIQVAIFAAGFILPHPPARATDHPHSNIWAGMGALMRAPGFAIFLIASACMQASHGMLYAFGSLHWLGEGLTKDDIGQLWALGVATEILLFFLAGRLFKHISPMAFLVIGASAAMVRWGLMGHVSDFWGLVPLQMLHALSFGAWHLAAMQMIMRLAPAHLQASAQGLYSMVGPGIGMGLVMALGGTVYAALGGWAFTLTALLPAISMGLLFALMRQTVLARA